MQALTRGRLSRTTSVTILAMAATLLAACSTSEPNAVVAEKPRSKEYFPESVYGVKASPRVSNLRSRLPRGGGRDQIGKPYKVRGKWYYPKPYKSYEKVGTASWYGDAFHGRLTANGEVYDMTHLTAAHPTMPLPSYARVTNTESGSSVIVRVNDRGPYSHGRIIDLSRRAAEMLDYTHSGTAQVKVEYVGRAPLDGQDDQFLMASYQPGNRAPDPSDGLPEGVMIAMNGPTPSSAAAGGALAAFPGELTDTGIPDGGSAPTAVDMPLPDLGPIAPERPALEIFPTQVLMASATMSYAGEPVSNAVAAFAALDGRASDAGVQGEGAALVPAPYVAAGSYSSSREAEMVASSLSQFGRIEVETSAFEGETWHTVNLYPAPGASVDDALESAWENGAPDAFAVRN
ncbi:septal ring lytic transglycosylase RlpA family protein [Arvimicrobium flavum]|uniref:septal ring lytic transglycosylase RlpA family protein n=1 Tax=Arvimicrobium flavum TaxID=3393320 RepID=UPI00237C017C|nr:septal ring lytic transglycosylase RlpA family protein [Mesorhizobium shangrilense]